MNHWVKAVIREAKAMGDYPYEMGGWGQPPDFGIDCRGFVQIAFKRAGARILIGGYQPNVRHMYASAESSGRLRGPEVTPGRAWLVFYYEPITTPEPGNPRHIRHVALVLQPISARYPKGRAISALNPERDVLIHNLNLKGLKILGFCEPDWASLDAIDPPMTDPEPPITVADSDI